MAPGHWVAAAAGRTRGGRLRRSVGWPPARAARRVQTPPAAGRLLAVVPAQARVANPDTAAFRPARTAALRTVAHRGTGSDQVPSLPDGEGWAAAGFHR